MSRLKLAAPAAFALLAITVTGASAQQIAVSTPFTSVNDSFFERIGTGFGFQLAGANPAGGRGVVGLLPNGQINPTGGIVFNQGGINTAIPQFGGYDPNGDATLGFGLFKGGNAMFFNLAASQGNTRNIINQTPTVVIPNGGTGTVSDTSQTPFVTSIIPVVGSTYPLPYYPTTGPAPHPLQERLERYYQQQKQAGRNSTQRAAAAAAALGNEDLSREEKLSLKADASRGSTAGHGDLSVAEIKQQQATAEAAKDQEVHALIERANGALDAGKPNVAKIYYRQAASRATGELRDDLLAKVQALGK